MLGRAILECEANLKKEAVYFKMRRELKILQQVAWAMEKMSADANIDRDSQTFEDLKAFDRAVMRIHRVCHNFKEEANQPDVRSKWTLNPAWYPDE